MRFYGEKILASAEIQRRNFLTQILICFAAILSLKAFFLELHLVGLISFTCWRLKATQLSRRRNHLWSNFYFLCPGYETITVIFNSVEWQRALKTLADNSVCSWLMIQLRSINSELQWLLEQLFDKPLWPFIIIPCGTKWATSYVYWKMTLIEWNSLVMIMFQWER